MAKDATWTDTMPALYDRCLGPALFAPWAQHLGAIAAGYAARSVLEIAAGSGILTAELVRALPSAAITATDLNPAMVSWAAQRVDGPTWQPADAQALPFPAGSFDLVLCQFGAMFFPDKAQAYAQVAKVLRPGGAFLFTVWDRVEASPFPAALTAALGDLYGGDAPDFVARIPHGYHDPVEITADLTAGGLDVHGVERFALPGAAVSAHSLAEGFCQGTPLRFALERHGNLQQITHAVAERMAARLGAGAVVGELAGLVVSAGRPG